MHTSIAQLYSVVDEVFFFVRGPVPLILTTNRSTPVWAILNWEEVGHA